MHEACPFRRRDPQGDDRRRRRRILSHNGGGFYGLAMRLSIRWDHAHLHHIVSRRRRLRPRCLPSSPASRVFTRPGVVAQRNPRPRRWHRPRRWPPCRLERIGSDGDGVNLGMVLSMVRVAVPPMPSRSRRWRSRTSHTWCLAVSSGATVPASLTRTPSRNHSVRYVMGSDSRSTLSTSITTSRYPSSSCPG